LVLVSFRDNVTDMNNGDHFNTLWFSCTHKMCCVKNCAVLLGRQTNEFTVESREIISSVHWYTNVVPEQIHSR
jgi:hypothetical protein